MNMFRRDVPVAIRFGRFLLDTRRRELFVDGVSVPIGSRAFDVLLTLVEAHGRLVTKDELISRVWGETIVEENTLQFQISMLRKVLGPDRDFIKTVCGRGYCFVAEISASPVPDAASFAHHHDFPAFSIPSDPASDLTGTEAMLAELADSVVAHRLAALAGSGCDRAPNIASALGLAEAGSATYERLAATLLPKCLALLLSLGPQIRSEPNPAP
jgi:DNA-binding winged helix-turn-helix (wHTH) protein